MDLDPSSYKRLGLRVGLELHAQLDTNKLFCSCSSELRENPSMKVKRFLRPTMSELGEVDRAALEEFIKGKTHFYEAFSDSNCLVYLDEEPPHSPTKEAVEVALKICLMLNAQIPDEIHFMRKIVIDGSNVSGFQRTAIVGLQGFVDTNYGRVNIPTICLEEDAARLISKDEKKVFWRIDRLGTPLVEIATAPEISDPEQAREVALQIGTLLKATSKVKRGIGAIRQDLNIDIKDGVRAEIKGVQELSMIPEYIREEVLRQKRLLEIREELRKRGVEEVNSKVYDLSEIFKATHSKLVREELREGKLLGVVLSGFSGLLGLELQKERRLGTEFSDYAKKYVSGILHSDELPGYGISRKEVDSIREKLSLQRNDAFVLVIAPREKGEKALSEVLKRANLCLKGIPKETRSPLKTGTTSFSRPLPGRARMYPETDVPPTPISKKLLERLKKELPELPEEKISRFQREYRLNRENVLKVLEHSDFFEEIVKKIDLKPTLFIKTFETLVSLRREGVAVERITEGDLRKLFELLKSGKLPKEAIEDSLIRLSEGEELKIETSSLKEVKRLISKIVSERKDFVRERGIEALGPLMGVCMKEFRGKVDGKIVSEILREEIDRVLRG